MDFKRKITVKETINVIAFERVYKNGLLTISLTVFPLLKNTMIKPATPFPTLIPTANTRKVMADMDNLVFNKNFINRMLKHINKSGLIVITTIPKEVEIDEEAPFINPNININKGTLRRSILSWRDFSIIKTRHPLTIANNIFISMMSNCTVVTPFNF